MKEQNKTALVLDDEMLIALDVEAMLLDLGFARVAVVPSVSEALDYLSRDKPDAAVIDFHVRGRNCEPVAGALRSLGVPTVIHSGTSFDPDYHGTFFADFPWLGKPSSREHLASALAAAIDQSKLTTD
ncbi:response regulator [Neorhizobium sp. JUb45]|uniref:response regulator n=1 Tax=Neorhizobium sp. JUb45 TaxID=2485113 RepID=UPI001048351C|nr:response regulator [Neorhizobium sp. JUb45]TCR07249.1 response regulator receiver domain-containing protein [Neorhizobium sp. JUb45]